MKAAKRRKLEARGYRVTDTKEFLGLSDAEARLVELKVSLIERVKEIREANKVTQAELAKLLKDRRLNNFPPLRADRITVARTIKTSPRTPAHDVQPRD